MIPPARARLAPWSAAAAAALLAFTFGAQAAAPDVRAVDAAGLRNALEAERGKVVVLNFWATWCDPCREEFPDLVKLAREYPGKVALLTVSLDDPDDLDARVRPFLEKTGAVGMAFIKGPGDPDAFIRSVDPEWSGALPATFVHGRDGRRARAIHGITSYPALKALVTPLMEAK